jgi:SAM-dependent methyltransferase
MGSVEDGIVEKFRNGGGLPYSAYPRFHEGMAEDSAQTTVAALKDHILPLVPGLTECLEASIDVLDVGCGSGRALNLMAREFPNSRFTGYDFSEEATARARRGRGARHGQQLALRGQGRGHPRRGGPLRPPSPRAARASARCGGKRKPGRCSGKRGSRR